MEQSSTPRAVSGQETTDGGIRATEGSMREERAPQRGRGERGRCVRVGMPRFGVCLQSAALFTLVHRMNELLRPGCGRPAVCVQRSRHGAWLQGSGELGVATWNMVLFVRVFCVSRANR